MTRLLRTLTVGLGVLLALGGGAFFLVRTQAHGRPSAGLGVTDGRGVPSLATGPAGSVSPGSTARPGANRTTTTPLSNLNNLTATLDATLAGTASCLTVEDGAGRVLYHHQPDAPLAPASTQKLLVAEAALARLGPDYRFTTSVVAPAAPATGRVDALWLVGNGDPLLATPEFMASAAGRARVTGYPWTPFATLSDMVASLGIKLVAGGVRGDDSYEDRLRFLPVWPAIYHQQNQIGLLSALSVNEGVQFTPPKPTLAQDPPSYAAGELARLLQLHKVAVGAAPDETAPPGAVVVATVSSAPLSQIVEAMLRASDNWIAELLVRAIDKAAGGTGTTAGGLAAIRLSAAQAGIPLSGVQMDDGSGLSRTDRATCRELLASLDLARQPGYGPVLSGLPLAGQTGTLALRYRRPPVAGKLRAKTGSIDNAGGMVGEMTVAAPLRFAFLDNDTQSDSALLAKEDAIVAVLAAYPGGG